MARFYGNFQNLTIRVENVKVLFEAFEKCSYDASHGEIEVSNKIELITQK